MIFFFFTFSYIFIINIKDPSNTPWTDINVVGVPDVPYYLGRETVVDSLSYLSFVDEMNSKTLPIKYDHAVAIIE